MNHYCYPTNQLTNIKYILFNKPYQVLSQFTSEEGKRTLAEFGFPKGIYTVGRLDYDSEGLLLLTDDWKVKHRFEDPKFQHPRTYLAQVERIPTEQEITKLRNGVTIKNSATNSDFTTLPCEAQILTTEPDLFPRSVPIRFRKNVPTSWLQLTLREGKNRQVRKMTAAIGYPTLRLVRVGIGELTLDGLGVGEWREVGSLVR